MSALIFPRLHQRPAHEPTVGGQPTPQNGRSGPSGTQVVIQPTHKIKPHAQCQIFPEEKLCSSKLSWPLGRYRGLLDGLGKIWVQEGIAAFNQAESPDYAVVSSEPSLVDGVH